ncbi:nucleobase:cation symporter-2 family protein [Pasteurella skyensis]|uniref:Nucleobase:cation symporter-2 family protein n=1 Tax=Phocoenobacter skyensis TaxID=97481 RepID=A0AAJ6P0X8_9PAST|nr:nucleobase:cation symporter-2 family protein [Pasteurella skyensis]MDP8163121.1 nucleobase:cation symporter-2 family protein [Pasteurella skyensis]MDP8173058.1 nucleobase:cation symporter-2 family protein [Pasteurella skyensis]MDP8177156.1 nucleobase:cation symporter-2 family protein [Pasteurella skyensis]MDP8179620.1 nucleobase:cation symporter-2 family protein [Pasteurella skyensis]MDP8183809.1 nucleobase:cation symporter-2 family protein [Pasteurella skyensis]
MNSKLFYAIEDKPPIGLSLLLALQHLLAAIGGIIAVPLVIGNVLKLPTEDTIVLVNAALLVSGIVTIIQCRGIASVGIRLPAVMGTSFTFVAAALAIGFSDAGVSGILGSSLVASLVMIIGSFFMPHIRKLFPPVVTGTVVMMIGLSLIPVAVDWFAGGQVGDPNYAAPENLVMAIFVLVIVVGLVQWGSGIFSAAAIVIGMMVGYIAALCLGWVDFSGAKSAQWFAIPQPLHFGLSFPISGIIGMSIAYLVTIVESSGNFLALGEATKTEVTPQQFKQGILAEGLGSALAAIMSTTPFSTFSQNIGLITLTGVASRYVVALTGALLVLAGLFPVFGALIVSIPLPVLGGAGIIMFAMIIAAGIQMLNNVERTSRNGLIIAIAIGGGLAVTTRPELLSKLPAFLKEIFGSGITVGALLALTLNLILPKDLELDIIPEVK